MKIAGLWSGHDCSFCILENGVPIVHAEYERYIREKEPKGDSVQFLIDECNDHFNDIKYATSCYPKKQLIKYGDSFSKLENVLSNSENSVYYMSHHKAHAANAFYSCNFDSSLILTLDGGGVEDESNNASACTVWTGNGNKIQHVLTFPMNQLNIGGMWTRATRYIFKLQSGWPRGHQAGTVMAMAAMGNKERFVNDFYTMLTKDIQYASFKPSSQPPGALMPGKDPIHPYLDKWVKIAEESEQNRFDLAAGLQHATELLFKQVIEHILGLCPGYTNLCLAGGVSLNSVMVGKILNWFGKEAGGPLENVYVTPTPHDGGLAIGSAQYFWHQVLDNPRINWKDVCSPYLGVHYNLESVKSAINDNDGVVKVQNVDDDYVIDLLDKQNIIAVYGGGSESGRRALGNRSILVDPRSPNMKDMINEKVKHRQWFRPFAPSILREEVKNWFTKDISSPYMSFVLDFKDEVKDKVPAVVHLDGTARLQTVTKNDNTWYYGFIKKWFEITSVPILLNTSFNDREPICETPTHAINCFLGTDIDYLYFYEYGMLLSKR
jgi:carbamoyltransferase